MEVWTGHVIDGHIVTAVKIFEQDHANATYPSDVWIRDHVCTLHVPIYVTDICCTVYRAFQKY